MDPNLPTPGAHELPPVHQTVDTMTPRTAAPEVSPVPGQGMPRAMQPQATTSQPLLPPVPPTASPVATPAVADDLDLIEKEWVEKAKAIVAQTRHDPHAQNQEINKFKADYMQKRYAKEIKIEP